MTTFLQVKDNAYARSPNNALNNTTANLTLNSLDTTKLPVVTTGFALTIWDDVTYPNPGDDPNMEKCLVSDADIAATGSLTLFRGNPKAHTGTPKMALLMLAQHVSDLNQAVNTLETSVAQKANATDVAASVTSLTALANSKATPADVNNAIAALVNSAPTTLDTLNEFAAALGNDPNFATTITALIGAKASTTYVDSQNTALQGQITTNTNAIAANTTAIAGKQATLVSGTSIKTINGTSLLGGGDIVTSSPDATSSTKGILQLTNDLGGTAASPTVMIGKVQYYNYVPNPSFEASYTNWKTYGTFGTITRDSTDAVFGTTSSKQVNAVSGDGGITSNALFALAAGTYTFSVYAKISSTVVNAHMVVRGSEGVKVQINQAYPGNNNWNRYTGTFVVSSAGTYEILLGQGSYGAGSTGTVSFDAVQIELASSASSYFDGSTSATSTEAYSWTGTSGDSQSMRATTSRLTSTDQLLEGAINLYSTAARTISQINGATISPGVINTTTITAGSAINPSVNNSRSLGTSSLYWGNIYGSVLNLNATASISGATAGVLAVTGQMTHTSGDTWTVASGNYPIALTTTTNAVADVIHMMINNRARFGYDNGVVAIDDNTTTKPIRITSSGSNYYYTGTGLALGWTGSGNNPTHTLTLPSTATGIALYNTSDQTTNYERLLINWSSNIATISTYNGGTGTIRNLAIGTQSAKFNIRETPSSIGTYLLDRSTSTSGAVNLNVAGTHTQSSGLHIATQLNPTINQTSTAGYTALLINPTETATGSGAKNLIDAQVGGTSKFKVTNTGAVSALNFASGVSGGSSRISAGTDENGANVDLFSYGGVLKVDTGYIMSWGGTGIKPGYNLGYAIGDASTYWTNLFSQKVTLNSTSNLDGSVSGVITATGDLRVATLGSNSASVTTKGQLDLKSNARRAFYAYEDFVNLINNQYFLSAGANGGNGGSYTVPDTNSFGIHAMNTSANAAGRHGVWSNNTNIVYFDTSAAYTYEARHQIPTLSTTVETFTIIAGFIDSITGDSTDGAYFSYTDGLNGGKYELITAKAGVRTRTDSGVTPTAGQWDKLRVVVASVGGTLTATFYINGVSVGAITTNVPNTTSNTTGYGYNIIKSVGTTNRFSLIDYMEIKAEYTADR
jgi:hypothetical protein